MTVTLRKPTSPEYRNFSQVVKNKAKVIKTKRSNGDSGSGDLVTGTAEDSGDNEEVRTFWLAFYLLLLFGSLIHQGVRCLYRLPCCLPPSLPVLGCLEGSVCREPCPLLDVVNIGSSGSAFASFTLRLPLYNCFCEV